MDLKEKSIPQKISRGITWKREQNKWLSLVFFKIRGKTLYIFNLMKTVIKYLVSAPLDSIFPYYPLHVKELFWLSWSPADVYSMQIFVLSTHKPDHSTAEVCQALNVLQKYAVLLGTARRKPHISLDQIEKVILIFCHLPRQAFKTLGI